MKDSSMDFIYFSLIHLFILFLAFMLYQFYRRRGLERKRRIQEKSPTDEIDVIEHSQNESNKSIITEK